MPLVSKNSHSSLSRESKDDVSDSGTCPAKQEEASQEEQPRRKTRRVLNSNKKKKTTRSSPGPPSRMETDQAPQEVSQAHEASSTPPTLNCMNVVNVATHQVAEQQQQQQQQTPPPSSWWLNQRNLPSFPLPYPVLVRPTSVPHEQSLFLRPLEDVPTNTTLESGNPRNLLGGEASTRKSFVEWKPMVTSSSEMNNTPPPPPPASSDLQLASSSWSLEPTGTASQLPLPNMSLRPPLGPSGYHHHHHVTGEERQLRFNFRDRERQRVYSEKQEAVAVVMEGRSVELGSICLQQYDGYGSLAAALRSMFAQNSGRGGEVEVEFEQECNLATAIPEHIVAYEDDEGDLLLAGDLSWRKFVRKAKRIRVLVSKGRNVVAVP